MSETRWEDGGGDFPLSPSPRKKIVSFIPNIYYLYIYIYICIYAKIYFFTWRCFLYEIIVIQPPPLNNKIFTTSRILKFTPWICIIEQFIFYNYKTKKNVCRKHAWAGKRILPRGYIFYDPPPKALVTPWCRNPFLAATTPSQRQW